MHNLALHADQHGVVKTTKFSAQKGIDVSQMFSDFESFDEGRLYIYVMRDPDPRTFPANMVTGDHFSGFFTGKQWGALFFDELKAPDRSTSAKGESPEVYSQRFAAAIPKNPKLGKISDMYIYVLYMPDEVEQLRSECLNQKRQSANIEAVKGLETIIAACNDASNSGSGLLFVPD